MNIFQQYGIKEVADVCLYAIELDENDDEIYIPVLYLDTLKVSTVEETAEQTSAQGGLGNPKLITWDYGKEITVNLEDALFTPASQGMTWGGKMGAKTLKLYLRNFFDRATDSSNPNGNLRGAILTVEQFSDFLIIPDRWPTYELKNGYCKQNTTGYVGGTSIYCWLVNANIISNDGKKRVNLYNLILFYREQTQKWYFFNGRGPVNNEETWFIHGKDENNIKRYAIGYQYGRDVFDWIRVNLSGNNSEKWEKYLKDEWTDGIIPGTDPETTVGVAPYNKATENNYRWTEYEGVAQSTYDGWTDNPPCEQFNRGPEYNVMGAEVAFLTQELYIDGYRMNKCARNQKYSDMTIDEKTAAGTVPPTYSPYRYTASVDVEYNTNVIPPQEAIYQIDHDLNDVFYLDRIEKCRATQRFCIDTDVNLKHGQYRYLEKYAETELVVYIDPKTMQPYEPNTFEYYRLNGQRITGNLRVFKQHEIYYKWTRTKAVENHSLGKQIIIDATHFPGTYRLVGETYARSRKTGKDQRYQFEIPLCKMGTNNNLTLQAEGEPTTFSMQLTALRRNDGVMMKLTSYDVVDWKYGKYTSGSTEIVPNSILVEPSDLDLEEANEEYIERTVEEEVNTIYTGLNIQTPTDLTTFDVNRNFTDGLTRESGASEDVSEDSLKGNIHVSVNYETDRITTSEWIRKDTINTDEPISIITSSLTDRVSGSKFLEKDQYTANLIEQGE